MKLVNLLITWLRRLIDRTIDLSALGEPLYLKNSEKEEGKMENESSSWTTDQISDIYAKLEVSKLLIKMGTDMAKQASDQITFYRMTNGIRDEFPDIEEN